MPACRCVTPSGYFQVNQTAQSGQSRHYCPAQLCRGILRRARALHLMRLEFAGKKETYSMSDRRWSGVFLLACAAVWAPLAAVAQWNPPNPVVSFDKKPNGLEIHQK